MCGCDTDIFTLVSFELPACPPLANTLPARLHIFGRKLLAGVESNFHCVSLSLSPPQSGAAGGRSERRWDRLVAVVVVGGGGHICAHNGRSRPRGSTPNAERARRRKESDSEFPNSFLIVLSRGKRGGASEGSKATHSAQEMH